MASDLLILAMFNAIFGLFSLYNVLLYAQKVLKHPRILGTIQAQNKRQKFK